jgi:hypothetical protein
MLVAKPPCQIKKALIGNFRQAYNIRTGSLQHAGKGVLTTFVPDIEKHQPVGIFFLGPQGSREQQQNPGKENNLLFHKLGYCLSRALTGSSEQEGY